MSVYLLVVILSLFCQLIPANDDKGYKRRLFFTFLPVFLFGALRVDFGYDYEYYESIFYETHYWSNLKEVSQHSEFGYLLLNRLIPTWRLFLILTSAFICISYGMFFYNCIPSKYSWLVVSLLFLAGDKSVFFMFSGIRNAIAIAFLIFGFSYIKDRKRLPFVVLTLLATTIHTSALFFMLLAYCIGFNKPMSRRESYIWLAVMFFLQIIPLDFIIDRAFPFINTYVDRYSGYTSIIEETGDTRSFLVKFTVAIFVIIMVWFMRTNELSKVENSICRLMLLYSMVGLLGALDVRMSQCFIIFFVCGSVFLIKKWKEKIISYGFAVLVFLYLGYAFFHVWMGSSRFPYQVYHSIMGSI